MESRVNELLKLKSVIERLDRIETQQDVQLKKQSQIEEMTERLDTIQNSLERQNQKQNLLHDKLSAVSVSTQMVEEKVFARDKLLSDVSSKLEQVSVYIRDQMSAMSTRLDKENITMQNQVSTFSNKLEQEKVCMRDQLKEAQDEILHRLTELQQQNASTRSQAVSVGEEMTQLKAAVGPNPVTGTAEFCSKSDGDFTDVRLAKMSEALGQTVKAVTRVELLWLDEKIDRKLSELGETVTEHFSELIKLIKELADKKRNIAESVKQEDGDMAKDIIMNISEEIKTLGELLKHEIQTPENNVAEKHNHLVLEQEKLMRTISGEIVTQVKKISSELSETLGKAKEDELNNMGAAEGKVVDTASLRDEIIRSHQASMETVVDHLDRIKEEIMENVNSECQKVKDDVMMSHKDTIYNSQEKLEITLKQSTKKIVGHLGPVKEEIMKGTNSACQQLKDMLKSQGKSEPAVKESTKSILASVGKAKEELMQVTKDLCQKLKADLISSQKDTLKNSQEKLETSLQESTKEVMHHLKEATGELVKNTTSACEKVNREMLLSQKETMQMAQEKIEEAVRGSTTNVTTHIEKVKGEISMIVNSECQTLKKETLNLNQETLMTTERRIQSTIKTSVDNVLTDLDKTKRDLVAHVEGQSQIVRDRIAGPLPEQRKYVCDFYIENFRQLVRSGKIVVSLPWHINQFDSSVCGYANFPVNGKMKLWLVFGRHPHELGLQPRLCTGLRLKYKATITDTSDKLPDVMVGEVTRNTWQEEAIKDNTHCGVLLGEISCDELLEKGYGKREGCKYSALLARYEIEI